jgi:DNA-binding transcriptional MerR regulator
MAKPALNPALAELPAEIPDKLYFRIGEVARLVGVEPYVLRYWESEFPMLAPKKSGSGHRLYRRKDVELLLEIKRLLYEKRYTIEGARQYLGGQGRGSQRKPAVRSEQGELFNHTDFTLEGIRKELAEILGILS